MQERASKNSVSAKPANVRDLLGLAWPERTRLGTATVCMGFSALATAAYAYLVGPVLRSLFFKTAATTVPGPHSDTLNYLSEKIGSADIWVISVAIVASAAIKGLAHFGQTALAGQAGQKVLFRLRARLYRGLLSLNPLRPEARSRGELIARFTVDVEAVEHAVTQGLVSFIRDGLQILALAGLAIALDPFLGLIGVGVFPIVAILIVRIGKRVRKKRADVHAAFGKLSSAVDETAAGLAIVQSFGAEQLVEERFARRSRAILSSAVRAIQIKAFSSPLNELLGACALAGTLWYAHSQISDGTLTPEAFISFFTALFLLYQPVKGLGQAQHALQAGLAALERLELLSSAAEMGDQRPNRAPMTPLTIAEVRLEAVCTGYENGIDVLREFDLTLPACHTIAVVGSSGAGKTTLLNLLQGFLPLRRGRLLVDSQPMDLDSHNARLLFAPVPQEPHLFDDTIRMNVLCGRPTASADEVDEACRAAGLTDFTTGLPDGIDTPVGPAGKDLSLGQRQRVCLARALISRAPILLLDEVTASLDGATELALVEGLGQYIADRTVLVVTHRLATASWADQVALLHGGRISVVGPIKDLIEKEPSLRELFGRQISSDQSE